MAGGEKQYFFDATNREHYANYLADRAKIEETGIILHKKFGEMVAGHNLRPGTVTLSDGSGESEKMLEIAIPDDADIKDGKDLVQYLIDKAKVFDQKEVLFTLLEKPALYVEFSRESAPKEVPHGIPEKVRATTRMLIVKAQSEDKDGKDMYEIATERTFAKYDPAKNLFRDEPSEYLAPIQLTFNPQTARDTEKDGYEYVGEICQYKDSLHLGHGGLEGKGMFSSQLSKAQKEERYGTKLAENPHVLDTLSISNYAYSRTLQTHCMEGLSDAILRQGMVGPAGLLADYATGAGKSFVQTALSTAMDRGIYIQPPNLLSDFDKHLKKQLKSTLKARGLSEADISTYMQERYLVIDKEMAESKTKADIDEMIHRHRHMHIIITMDALERECFDDNVIQSDLVFIDEADHMADTPKLQERLHDLINHNALLALTGTVNDTLAMEFPANTPARVPAYTLRQAIEDANCRNIDTADMEAKTQVQDQGETIKIDKIVTTQGMARRFGHVTFVDGLNQKDYKSPLAFFREDESGASDEDRYRSAVEKSLKHNAVKQATMKGLMFASSKNGALTADFVAELTGQEYSVLSSDGKAAVLLARQESIDCVKAQATEYYTKLDRTLGKAKIETLVSELESVKTLESMTPEQFHQQMKAEHTQSHKQLLGLNISTDIAGILLGIKPDDREKMAAEINVNGPDIKAINKMLSKEAKLDAKVNGCDLRAIDCDTPQKVEELSQAVLAHIKETNSPELSIYKASTDEAFADMLDHMLLAEIKRQIQLYHGQYEQNQKKLDTYEREIRILQSNGIDPAKTKGYAKPKLAFDMQHVVDIGQTSYDTHFKPLAVGTISTDTPADEEARVKMCIKRGLMMDAVSDTSIATGFSDKQVLSTILLISDIDDDLLHPPYPTQSAGRAVRGKRLAASATQILHPKVIGELRERMATFEAEHSDMPKFPETKDGVPCIFSYNSVLDMRFSDVLAQSFTRSEHVKSSPLRKGSTQVLMAQLSNEEVAYAVLSRTPRLESVVEMALEPQAPSINPSEEAHKLKRPEDETAEEYVASMRQMPKPKPDGQS